MKYLRVQNFKGIFSRDEINKFSGNGLHIINLDSSWGPGTHWVACHCNERKKRIEYFDSFGLYPPQETIDLAKKFGYYYVYNSHHLQNIKSATCGYFAIYFCNEIQNKTYYDLLKPFSFVDTNKNEAFIRKYFDTINI